MKCSYCNQQAVIAGEAPPGTGGLKELWACDLHAHRLTSLKFITTSVAEMETKKKRERLLAERESKK